MKRQPFTSSRRRSAAGVADDCANLPDRLYDTAPAAPDSRAAANRITHDADGNGIAERGMAIEGGPTQL
jgi:hypothetical protein